MKRTLYFLLFMLMSGIAIISCSKDNEMEQQQNNNNNNSNGNTCVTDNMKFSTNIRPILEANCYACHSNANKSVSGISLEGYDNVKIKVDDGHLIGAITHATGFSPMPKGGAKLSDCNINKIKSWVNSGAPNN